MLIILEHQVETKHHTATDQREATNTEIDSDQN